VFDQRVAGFESSKRAFSTASGEELRGAGLIYFRQFTLTNDGANVITKINNEINQDIKFKLRNKDSSFK